MDSNMISILAAKVESFPALPAVVTRVMQVTADPDATADDLMRVVRLDQSLVLLILKMANSALFGLPRKVDSLQQALTILGFAEIRNMVLAKGLFSSFKGLKEGDRFDINRFWEHSIVCAISARIMAVDFGRSGGDLFVAGLIHDIGKLAMYMWFPTEFSKIIEAAEDLKLDSFQAEKEILGLTHGEVGMALLDRWLFPGNLISAVGFHHRPRDAEKERLFPLMIHMADLLAHLSACGNGENDERSRLKKDLFSSEIKHMCESLGIVWNDSALARSHQELMKQKEGKAEFLALLLS